MDFKFSICVKQVEEKANKVLRKFKAQDGNKATELRSCLEEEIRALVKKFENRYWCK
jgi:hypothetical protein